MKDLIKDLEAIGLKPIVVDENTVLDMALENSEFVEKTPSHFLNGTRMQFAWDATSLEDFKRCPRLYYYTMIKGYRSKKENIHLRFGLEFHEAMNQYQLLIADGIDHDEAVWHTVKELLIRTDEWRPDDKYKNRFNLLRSVIRYLDKYQNDPAKTLILSNGKPAVEISFRIELDWGPTKDQPWILCGYIDRMVEFGDAQFFMDYKTTTTTPSDWYWAQFHPHNQMSLYTIVSNIIFETPIKGGIIRSGQIMMDDTRYTESITYRTKDEMEEWLNDLNSTLEEAVKCVEKNYWPMRDTSCDKYGGCKFRDICSKSPKVREKFLKADFEEGVVWNPLEPR